MEHENLLRRFEEVKHWAQSVIKQNEDPLSRELSVANNISNSGYMLISWTNSMKYWVDRPNDNNVQHKLSFATKQANMFAEQLECALSEYELGPKSACFYTFEYVYTRGIKMIKQSEIWALCVAVIQFEVLRRESILEIDAWEFLIGFTLITSMLKAIEINTPFVFRLGVAVLTPLIFDAHHIFARYVFVWMSCQWVATNILLFRTLIKHIQSY